MVYCTAKIGTLMMLRPGPSITNKAKWLLFIIYNFFKCQLFVTKPKNNIYYPENGECDQAFKVRSNILNVITAMYSCME